MTDSQVIKACGVGEGLACIVSACWYLWRFKITHGVGARLAGMVRVLSVRSVRALHS
jgi:hypothetical protein